MNKLIFAAALAAAAAVGVTGTLLWQHTLPPTDDNGADTASDDADDDKGEPLYWVAPMDDSYRRDEPGESPMGMDLVPVYPGEEDQEPGDVKVNPTVAQNLGLVLAEAQSTRLEPTLHALGRVNVNQRQLRHYHVRAPGWITELNVATEGDPVSAGDKLFEFYSPEIVNLQHEYLQGLRDEETNRARASLLQMRAKGVSEREIERLRETQTVREKLHYYADRDGYVVALGVREGNRVDLPQNLMSIGSLDDIWVTVEVFERDAGRIREGQTVTLTSDTYPAERWEGEVDYLYPSLNTDTRTLRARLVFPNEDGRLKPGMYLNARLTLPAEETVLTIPASALIRTGDGERVVREVAPDVYRSVRVKTGHQDDERVAILKGLKAGDRVVRDGLFLIDSESSREADLSRIDAREEMDHSNHGGEAR